MVDESRQSEEEEQMSHRCLAAVCTVIVGVAVSSIPAAAQTAPRTAWGQPDLQGVWDFRTITPLQRPEHLADQEFLTEEEAANIEQEAADRDARLWEQGARRTDVGGNVGAYNNFWMDQGLKAVGTRRTSLIVDPPDGRLPPLRPGAVEQVGSGSEDVPGHRPVRFRVGGIGADGPEDRGLGVRCLLGFNSGPPMMPSAYNNNMQLFQTAAYVVILNEMVHDARIVPLDRQPHLPENVRQWMGDARGHWDGDTLVVETTNFTNKTPSFNPTITSSVGTGETLTLIERFRRVDADTLLYEYTVDDPTTFTRAFTAVIPMRKSDAPIFEYACHEGNYGMEGILAGGRAEDRAAAQGSR
jgi:hypothetical protein